MWGAERSSGRNCPVSAIYIQSLTTGEIPGDWKCANVTPVLKKGSKKEACNYIYRPVPLTSLPCKILEHIIFHHIMGHLDVHHVLVNYQHGFRRGPLMWKPGYYNSRTHSQKLRPWQTDWCIIAGLLQGIWYGPAQTSRQEIRSLRNPWTTDQMDRILALRKISESCC